MTEVIFRPAAAADVEDAFHWYEAQRPGLGSDFIASVRAGLQAILANPEINAVMHRNARRALLKRFPYTLYYRIYPKSIVVVACMHGRRDPLRWQPRS
ncbi:MAG: type II toxin-antitoxin system RelE/ParE family toxin [Gammaproteobacteria bacterium]